MGWENWHLHCFHLWGKDYGLSYAGGTWYVEDARRVHLGDFAWRANDKFTYTYDFGDYWQHQVRVEKLLPPTAVPATPGEHQKVWGRQIRLPSVVPWPSS